MTADPSSGPGSGLLASKQTVISSAQLKALFTTPLAVSPAPRSDQIIVPTYWTAVAANSATSYLNPSGGVLSIGYAPTGGHVNAAGLLAGLTSGDPSFLRARVAEPDVDDLTQAAGLGLVMAMDSGNLTTGNFPVTFTLLYTLIQAT